MSAADVTKQPQPKYLSVMCIYIKCLIFDFNPSLVCALDQAVFHSSMITSKFFVPFAACSIICCTFRFPPAFILSSDLELSVLNKSDSPVAAGLSETNATLFM